MTQDEKDRALQSLSECRVHLTRAVRALGGWESTIITTRRALLTLQLEGIDQEYHILQRAEVRSSP